MLPANVRVRYPQTSFTFSVLISVSKLSTLFFVTDSTSVLLNRPPTEHGVCGRRWHRVAGKQPSISVQGALWNCWSGCQQDQTEQQSSIWSFLLGGGDVRETSQTTLLLSETDLKSSAEITSWQFQCKTIIGLQLKYQEPWKMYKWSAAMQLISIIQLIIQCFFFI